MDYPDHTNMNIERPLLSNELKNQVVVALIGQGVELDATNDDWGHLERILRRYETYAAFWEGFPRQDDAKKLLGVGKKAKKLVEVLRALNEEGFGAIVRDQIQDNDLDAFISTLQLLGELDVRSPRIDSDEKPSWQAVVERSAAAMQVEVDQWWEEVVGQKPIVSEDGTAPYTYFLNQVFRYLSGTKPGGSRTAVESRRRKFREQEKQATQAMNALRNLSSK